MASFANPEASSPTQVTCSCAAGKAEPKSAQTSEMAQVVTDGMIALAPTNEKGERAGIARAPQPYASTNPVFNLVTSQDSVAYGNECRAAVDAALRVAGLDPAQYSMSYWEEAVSYPGGGYLNKCITVETPQGYRMDFNAALALQHPLVTASEIRLLTNGYWNTGATAS